MRLTLLFALGLLAAGCASARPACCDSARCGCGDSARWQMVGSGIGNTILLNTQTGEMWQYKNDAESPEDWGWRKLFDRPPTMPPTGHAPQAAAEHGPGILEFHILADDRTPQPQVQEMIKRLETQGPATEAGDNLRWFQTDRTAEFSLGSGPGYPQDYHGKRYVLCSIEPGDSMIHKKDGTPWTLAYAYATTNTGRRCVGLAFDPQGAKLFSELTDSHQGDTQHGGYRLAIMLDGLVLSAPLYWGVSKIGGGGILEGVAPAGYSDADLKYLIDTLNAGSHAK